ncbi:glycosyltransferase family 2 protein [Edaphovirga cremea]|uniref:glycosyltransferase family 2 protein n=1 Tax=Edaphovirga cremea TaxID=2267246 RepID=UPI000DF00BB0|nr:glycosyltransferase family 2 protein [Edaphovirga cremea]
MKTGSKIAVVIPCYKVKKHIVGVIEGIGQEVERIYVIDDCCPEDSGDYVNTHCTDPRVHLLRHVVNQGVGGAVMTGYQAAISDQMDIIVKIDGDGQMDPRLLLNFVTPILQREADYTKGNRFFNLENIRTIPRTRLFGNAILSFMTKISSGYWGLFDPVNGYTAIHRDIARQLPFDKISRRYFFETDMLFRLNTLRAVVMDVPMSAKYADEISNLKVSKVIGDFLFKHMRNFVKRIFYNYYLRDMSVASLELPLGIIFTLFGTIYGGVHWLKGFETNIPAPAGTVMFSAMPVIVGIQFILAFISYDIASVPDKVQYIRYSPTSKTDRGSL